jgi:hypothetical protein
MSNHALWNINKTDVEFLTKHNIVIDRIVVPSFVRGYRFIGAENAFQEF